MKTMLHFDAVDATYCDLIFKIIGRSFGEQAELLGVDRERYLNFVASEAAEGIRRRMDRGDHVVLAYWKQKAIGTVSYNMDADQFGLGYIKRLAVLPEYRGNTFGCQLMRHAE